ncbi:MAG: type II toxin-antitoxin system RelE/ParE family toxin [Pseudomonadota bacterium]
MLVVLYKEEDETCPVLQWLDDQSASGQERCEERLTRLSILGHEIRRPAGAPLRDGIYELRVREEKVRLRMLFFFHGRDKAVVVHGFKKKTAEVPSREIDVAIEKKKRYEADPEAHTLYWEPKHE